MLKFTPIEAEVVEGEIKALNPNRPYASVVIEYPKIQGKAEGYITHKVDFAMLWAAFNERTQVKGARVEVAHASNRGPAFIENSKLTKPGVATHEEINLIWSKKHYKRGVILKRFLPRLVVMVSPKGAYELATDPSFKPELHGESRWHAVRPYATWKPEVME